MRQGLPSSVGEQLLRTAVYDLYVRDRSEQVHFTGKNYVLPRVGQQGIPVVSVNVKKVAVQILRVSDRNLLPIISSSDFLTQLSSYRMQQFKDSDGENLERHARCGEPTQQGRDDCLPGAGSCGHA